MKDFHDTLTARLLNGGSRKSLTRSGRSNPLPNAFIVCYYVLLHQDDHADQQTRVRNRTGRFTGARRGNQPRRILRFLADNPDTAFTQTEIHEETDIKRGSVGGVLSRLESCGLVRHRGRYWMIAADDRLVAYSAQKSASSASVTDDYFEGIDADDLEDL